jgi:hypothetical protein
MLVGTRPMQQSSGCNYQIRVQRLLVLAGILAPILFAVLFTAATLLRPGYNSISHFGSELELGRFGWLQRTNFMLLGLLEIVFAYGLQRGLKESTGTKIAAAFIALSGLGMISIGLFIGGSMHFRAVKVFHLGLIAAYLVLAWQMRQDKDWRRYAPYSVVVAVVSFLAFMVYLYGMPGVPVYAWIGLVQRFLFAALLGWLEIIALRLLALTPK